MVSLGAMSTLLCCAHSFKWLGTRSTLGLELKFRIDLRYVSFHPT